LKYLRGALKLEKQDELTTPSELAGTYLNLCAIFSSLGRHYDAIRTAIRAINLVKKCLPKSERVKHKRASSLSQVNDSRDNKDAGEEVSKDEKVEGNDKGEEETKDR